MLSRSRVSRPVDELEGACLVARQDHPDDRRSAFAVLTDAGRTAYRRAAPIYLRHIQERFAGALTEQEMARLGRLLERVASAAQA